ncbi:hypothetical protein PHLCEN_2v6239 [Hermanssonia centrifuga]|uniref:Cytochrome P450 n=1 Tax=Hermanssonia centrifuga TaxID=98765 RepID=A0A2R6NZZ4_9APHY|nr:hypothetical protein PHLCEN_2v6239 [Hermanssonia centrifuga]
MDRASLIGPNELSIIPKETVSNILGPKGLPRGPYYDTRKHEEGTSLDGIKEYTVHAVRRRPWARGMNSTAMKYYEGVIKEETANLIHGLRERKSKEVDISAWMSFFSFDAMGRMSFSYDLRMLKDGRDSHGLSQQIENGLIEAAWISHVQWLVPFLKYIPSASKSWEEIKAVGERLVRRRAQDGSIHPDIFYYLMNEDGQEITKPVIEVCAIDGMLAIIAGSDTSATTLSHLWYYLLSNSACFNQLRSEVDEVFPLGEDPLNDLSKLGTMSYLNACINEVLRLYPPVLAALQRRVEPDRGGVMVGDHLIPPETQVSLYAYAIHRDPSHFWPIPDQFWPDRWLSQEEYTLPSGDRIASVITDHEVFIPFSAGPMGCVGKNVAMAEMRAVVSTVVQQFDMTVANQSNLAKWEEDIREVFVTSRGTLPVVLKPRHS